MSDLVEFLRARFDEREATALKAAERDGMHWTAGSEHVGSETTSYIAVGPWEGPLAETGEHMAHHDPAWVLADVEAKRRTLARHRNCGTGTGYCDDGGHGIEAEDDAGVIGCADLLDLAAPYAKHPEYKQEWSA